MDSGVGLDGLVGSGTTNCSSGFASVASSSTPETKLKWYGSGLLKQGRPATAEDNWRSSKLSKKETMQLPQRSGTSLKSDAAIFSDSQQQQQMLSFSCPKPALSVERSTHSASLPYFHLTSSAHSKNTGYSSGSFNVPSLHGAFFETRGPFTPSQWMELEHQALIFKHIAANAPIPSNLLIPIRKALDSAGISSFSGGLLRPVPWGAFDFGFSGNGDQEPGRCRRTDGKKWRCSKDAVPDQKYCERHMNRGRHRSRKPVEGQSGHSAATTSAKPMSAASSSVSASVVGPLGGGAPNSLTIAQNHQQQPVHSSTNPSVNFLGRMIQDSPNFSMLSSNIDQKSKEIAFMISKHHNSNAESPRSEFGLMTSDYLMNPSHTSSSLISCTNFSSSHDLTDRGTLSQHSLCQFMDDWPKTQSDRSAVSLSGFEMKSDGTMLSISTPAAPTDFMSSTSSPDNKKTTVSPLRLSRDFDSIQAGQGVGSFIHEFNHMQANWIPISWESSLGGPLGEVLHSTNSGSGDGVTEGWENSPRLGSSPTGVLQKTLFGYLSNSSTGSSPRAENVKTTEGADLCNNLLGSAPVHSSSLPAL